MDRRNFLKSVTGVATAVAAGTATAEALPSGGTSKLTKPRVGSDARKLRLALCAPDNGQGVSDFCHQFAARVHAASEGAIQFNITTHVGLANDAIRNNGADCYCTTEHDNQRVLPELAFFAGLPGATAMDGVTFHNWLSVGGGQELWDDISSEFGVKSLAIAHTGPASGLWSSKPISSLSVLSGRAIFAEGLAVDVVKGIGAEAFEANTREVAKGLSNDVLFAAEVGDIPTALSIGLVEAANVLSSPGINRAGSTVAFGIQKSIWESLSTGERALIEAAAASTFHDTIAFARSQHDMMVTACTRQFGVQFNDLAPDVLQTVDRVSEIVIAHLASASPRAGRINASYMAFRKANGLTT